MKKIVLLVITVLISLNIFSSTTNTKAIGKNRLTISFKNKDYKIDTNSSFTKIITANSQYTSITGAPEIPFYKKLIGIPPKGDVQVNILNSQKKKYKLDKPIQPKPKIIKPEKSKSKKLSKFKFIIDKSKYRDSRKKIVQKGKSIKIGNNLVCPIIINPFQYDYDKKELIVIEELELSININGKTKYRNTVFFEDPSLKTLLENYEQSRFWRKRTKDIIEYADFSKSDFWYKIKISNDGMHILQDELNTLPDFADPSTIRLFTTGGELLDENSNGNEFKEIPIIVKGEENGVLDPEDQVIFYAQDRDDIAFNEVTREQIFYNPYSGNGCYWLTFGGEFESAPKRITTQDHSSFINERNDSKEIIHLEEQNSLRHESGFTWFWKKLYGRYDADYPFNVELNNVNTSKKQTLTFKLYEYEYNDNTHRAIATVNGIEVINSQWYSSTYYLDGETNFAQNGNNEIILTILRNGTDNFDLDYLEIEYYKNLNKNSDQFFFTTDQEDNYSNTKYNFTGNSNNVSAFEVQNFYEINKLPITQNGSNFSFIGYGQRKTRYYLADENDYYQPESFTEINPTDLTAEDRIIQDIIITPEEFLTQSEELKDLHESSYQYSTKVVLLKDIFNQFNAGMPDPVAIKTFLKYAYFNYPQNADKGLTHVLLVGSGTFDWRNYSNQATEKNRIPVFQDSATSSDDNYVQLQNSNEPDLSIGRLPAQNSTQLDRILSRLENYTNSDLKKWKNKTLILADDFYNTGDIDTIEHTEQAEATANAIDNNVEIDKIMAVEYERDEMQNKPQVADLLINNINEGLLLWYYIGHGDYYLLGSEDFFQSTAHLPRLDNLDNLSFFIAASCSVGFYDSFAFDCLAEQLLYQSNGGSIASLAATRESSGTANTNFIKAFLKDLLNERLNVGLALKNAKITSDNYSNSVRYNYLGDPLVDIKPPAASQNFYDQQIKKRETLTLNGNFDDSSFQGTTDIKVYSALDTLTYSTKYFNNQGEEYTYSQTFTKRKNPIYSGTLSIENGEYSAKMIIPDDSKAGDSGLLRAFYTEESTGTTYVNYFDNLTFTNQTVEITDNEGPEIEMTLDYETFQDGDLVSSSPLLTAEISDENGINTSGKPGHKILAIIDNDQEIVDITSAFSYDKDSYQSGTLEWQFDKFTEGHHSISLLIRDSFNNASTKTVNFRTQKDSKINISDFMVYPNPMPRKGGYFTFVSTKNASIEIEIFTITGKKIKSIEKNCSAGYNQISWDGRDEDGDRLANNTYFVKIKGKSSNKNTSQKIEKFVIYE